MLIGHILVGIGIGLVSAVFAGLSSGSLLVGLAAYTLAGSSAMVLSVGFAMLFKSKRAGGHVAPPASDDVARRGRAIASRFKSDAAGGRAQSARTLMAGGGHALGR